MGVSTRRMFKHTLCPISLSGKVDSMAGAVAPADRCPGSGRADEMWARSRIELVMYVFGIALALLLFPGMAQATAQIPDVITIEGQSYPLHTEPLAPYLRNEPALLMGHLGPSFCTASWRGYRAMWEIIETKLYLVGINEDPCSTLPKPVPLKKIFPGDPVRKFADWYSGVITIAQGKMVKPIPGGYASKYERYLRLTIKDGVVTKEDRNDMEEEERRDEARWQAFLDKTRKSGSIQEGAKLDQSKRELPNFSEFGTDMKSIFKYLLALGKTPIEVCRAAFERKNADGAYCLAERERGDQRVSMWKQSAEFGHPLGQSNLAHYLDSLNNPELWPEVHRLILSAARSGIPHAQVSVGWWSMTGEHGFPVNYAEAMEWNLKAYKQGHSEGANNIGELYEKGHGMTKNIDEAKFWYQKASELGNTEATSRLKQLAN